MKRIFPLLIGLLACFALLAAQAPHQQTPPTKPTTVLLVRHAEKIRIPASDDPALTPEGIKRADNLARMAGQTGIKAIFATQYLRTRATAEPLARKLGLPVQQIDAGKTQQLVDKILKEHAGETVLVVGHSDSVPQIIEALGAGKMPVIPDDEFDNLYIVTVYAPRQATAVRLKY